MKKTWLFLFLAACLLPLSANKISDSQSNWYEKYKKQENAPKPENMLLNTEAEPDLSTGFVDLYNKKNLNGWTALGGHCEFKANGEQITGICVPKSPSTYLSTDKNDFENFIFTCDIKWEVDGNTGIMFRAKVKEETKKGEKKVTVYGPQVEMEGTEKGRGWSGGIYGQSCGGYWYPLWLDAHKEIRGALKKGDWNRVTIKADGNNVKTWINGIPAANWNTEEYLKGYFGLQIHSGKQGTVHFKNIKVKEL